MYSTGGLGGKVVELLRDAMLLLYSDGDSHDPTIVDLDRESKRTPEQKLAAALLYSAIVEYNHLKPFYRKTARDWLHNKLPHSEPLSARWCLAALGYPDYYLRLIVEAGQRAHPLAGP